MGLLLAMQVGQVGTGLRLEHVVQPLDIRGAPLAARLAGLSEAFAVGRASCQDRLVVIDLLPFSRYLDGRVLGVALAASIDVEVLLRLDEAVLRT